MGGLVIQWALTTARLENPHLDKIPTIPFVENVITVATPNQGIPWSIPWKWAHEFKRTAVDDSTAIQALRLHRPTYRLLTIQVHLLGLWTDMLLPFHCQRSEWATWSWTVRGNHLLILRDRTMAKRIMQAFLYDIDMWWRHVVEAKIIGRSAIVLTPIDGTDDYLVVRMIKHAHPVPRKPKNGLPNNHVSNKIQQLQIKLLLCIPRTSLKWFQVYFLFAIRTTAGPKWNHADRRRKYQELTCLFFPVSTNLEYKLHEMNVGIPTWLSVHEHLIYHHNQRTSHPRRWHKCEASDAYLAIRFSCNTKNGNDQFLIMNLMVCAAYPHRSGHISGQQINRIPRDEAKVQSVL